MDKIKADPLYSSLKCSHVLVLDEGSKSPLAKSVVHQMTSDIYFLCIGTTTSETFGRKLHLKASQLEAVFEALSYLIISIVILTVLRTTNCRNLKILHRKVTQHVFQSACRFPVETIPSQSVQGQTSSRHPDAGPHYRQKDLCGKL